MLEDKRFQELHKKYAEKEDLEKDNVFQLPGGEQMIGPRGEYRAYLVELYRRRLETDAAEFERLDQKYASMLHGPVPIERDAWAAERMRRMYEADRKQQ